MPGLQNLREAMTYQLYFCLFKDDTGSPANPALAPVVDADGKIRNFASLDEAHRVLSRLRRLADGLIYYVLPEPGKVLQIPTSVRTQPGARRL